MLGHAKMLADVKAQLLASDLPVRIIVGHRALLPAAIMASRNKNIHGITLICHGHEVWPGKTHPRKFIESRLMRRKNVRLVAVSSYTAGAISPLGNATLLPPGLARNWFDALVAAADKAQRPESEFRLVTAFRLSSWRQKGLPEIVAAISSLDRHDISLKICGSGDPPPGLVDLIAAHKWCTLQSSISDSELALELARADLFILATRTTTGDRSSGEGFGMVLLEAQVAATPVVAPAHGGSSDAYLAGLTGVAPVDETADSLALELSAMISDREGLVRMGKYARDWARNEYLPESYSCEVVKKLL
jgi:phosphatidyl-myo-inositol dimannoside synthase